VYFADLKERNMLKFDLNIIELRERAKAMMEAANKENKRLFEIAVETEVRRLVRCFEQTPTVICSTNLERVAVEMGQLGFVVSDCRPSPTGLHFWTITVLPQE
jgi:hypothetical protein